MAVLWQPSNLILMLVAINRDGYRIVEITHRYNSSRPSTNNKIFSSISGPISYRLGNQRRLKYAPPPDITSNTSKPYSAPAVQPLLTPPNTATPTIFNPNESTAPAPSYQVFETPISTNSPSIQRSTPEYLSQTNSLQGSFRSSPVATGIPYSSTGTSGSVTPQNQNSSYDSVPIPERPNVPLSASRLIPSQFLEPTTPQNTPANPSVFGFDAYAGQREFHSRAFNADRETIASKSSPSHTDPLLPILKNTTIRGSSEPKPTVTFAPVSAVQVSEKLEHLLAEQENSSNLSTGPSAKTEASAAECLVIESSHDVNLDSTPGNIDLSQLDGSVAAPKKQGTPDPTRVTVSSQGLPAAEHGNFDAPERHGASSNVQPTQQYYQPRPFTSGSDFFVEQPAEQRSSLNYVPVTEAPGGFASPANTFVQSASSFFNTPGGASAFLPFEPKGRNEDAFVDVASTRNDFQQVALDSSIASAFANPSVPAHRPFWDASQCPETVGATSATSIQPSTTPLFYNPVQYQTELHGQSVASHSHATSIASPTTNQAHYYFDNFTGSTQTYDLTEGAGGAFLPTSVAAAVTEPTGSATLNPIQMSINPLSGRANTYNVPPSFQNLVSCWYLFMLLELV